MLYMPDPEQNDPFPDDEELVIALASGDTIVKAAELCGIARKTVYRRLQEDSFQARIDAAKKAFSKRAMDRLISYREEAVEVMYRIAINEDESAGARLRAARDIIELGSQLHNELDLAERVKAIEARLATKAPQ